jgi:uncharacterized protein
VSVTQQEWEWARQVVHRAVGTSIHCAVASRDADGSPHVTPIGSVTLTEPGRGFYFDIFNTQLARNISEDPRVAILAVDSGKLMWLRSLLGGRFVRAPGVRLVATVGARRPSTPAEVASFHRLVGPLRHTRGGRMLWGALPVVRDIEVERIIPLRTGTMTGVDPGGPVRG